MGQPEGLTVGPFHIAGKLVAGDVQLRKAWIRVLKGAQAALAKTITSTNPTLSITALASLLAAAITSAFADSGAWARGSALPRKADLGGLRWFRVWLPGDWP